MEREDFYDLMNPEYRDGLPDANPKTRYGLAKPSFSVLPVDSLIPLMRVMQFGAEKYGRLNWRDEKVSFSTYFNAAMRHMLSAWDGETADPETGQPHVAHAMACMGIILDAAANGALIDDRPRPGVFAELVRANTEKMAPGD